MQCHNVSCGSKLSEKMIRKETRLDWSYRERPIFSKAPSRSDLLAKPDIREKTLSHFFSFFSFDWDCVWSESYFRFLLFSIVSDWP